jgi:hypothetical protein
MKTSALLNFNSIRVVKVSFEVKPGIQIESDVIAASDLDFEVIPMENKEDCKKKVVFKIFLKNHPYFQFELIAIFDYTFCEKKSEKEEANYGITVIIPQAISFARAILFSVSSMAKIPLVLPAIDTIASWKEKVEVGKNNLLAGAKKKPQKKAKPSLSIAKYDRGADRSKK